VFSLRRKQSPAKNGSGQMKMEGGAPPFHEDRAVGAAMEGIWSGRRRLLVASVRAEDVKWIGKAVVVVVIVVSRVERRVSQGMVVCLGIFGEGACWLD
jgi:hypothetical protein